MIDIAKNILIVGGTSGIGKNLIKEFQELNFNVIFTYNNSKPQDLGKIKGFKLDLTSKQSIDDFAHTLLNQNKIILDAIIFCATSYKSIGNLTSLNHQEVLEDYAVNVIGPHYLLKMVLPSIRSNNYSSIIFLLGGGQGPKSNLSTYISSKNSLIGLVESIAEELRNLKINIFGVYPGPLQTKFLTKLIELGPNVIGMDLYEHVVKNSKAHSEFSENLMLTLSFLINLRQPYSGKFISARYDAIYSRELTKLDRSDLFTFKRITE